MALNARTYGKFQLFIINYANMHHHTAFLLYSMDGEGFRGAHIRILILCLLLSSHSGVHIKSFRTTTNDGNRFYNICQLNGTAFRPQSPIQCFFSQFLLLFVAICEIFLQLYKYFFALSISVSLLT